VDIKLIPLNTALLIDANIFLYHLSDASNECSDFLDKVADGDFEVYVTTIIGEILHRRMTSEALNKGLISSGQPVKRLKANPTLITALSDYITDVKDLLQLPIQVIEVTLADIAVSHQLRQTHGLFVNDSINLACAQRFGITDIVSRDTDFSAVSVLSVWQPTDI
jgi:predicted nucleic acid-binding protein